MIFKKQIQLQIRVVHELFSFSFYNCTFFFFFLFVVVLANIRSLLLLCPSLLFLFRRLFFIFVTGPISSAIKIINHFSFFTNETHSFSFHFPSNSIQDKKLSNWYSCTTIEFCFFLWGIFAHVSLISHNHILKH